MQNKKGKSISILIVILIILLVFSFFVSLLMGRYNISSQSRDSYMILLYIRLPRIVCAMAVGAALSTAGTIYQSIFQNPIASPDILGCSNGAAVGAAFAILFGFTNNIISLYAFLFGIFTVSIVFFLGDKVFGNKMISLILSGIVISSIFQAILSYLKIVADPSNKLPAITYWLLGSFYSVSVKELFFLVIPILFCFVIVLFMSWHLNVLSLGEEEAITLGVNVRLYRYIFLMLATMLTAISVAFSGVIGYVGLVIPNFARRLVGNNNQVLVPVSALLGAIFLLLVDDVSRNLLSVEIPIGILTAIIGAPFFLYLMSREVKRNA